MDLTIRNKTTGILIINGLQIPGNSSVTYEVTTSEFEDMRDDLVSLQSKGVISYVLDAGNVEKIDNAAIDGLLGTPDSLGYKVHEIEDHFHNANYCFGNDGFDNMEQDSTTAFRVTSDVGAPDGFGSLLRVHDGTVFQGGNPTMKVDVGTLFVPASQRNDQTYVVHIMSGLVTPSYLTGMYYRTGANGAEVVPLKEPCPRIPCNHQLWVKTKCSDAANSWLDFMFHVHFYPG